MYQGHPQEVGEVYLIFCQKMLPPEIAVAGKYVQEKKNTLNANAYSGVYCSKLKTSKNRFSLHKKQLHYIYFLYKK